MEAGGTGWPADMFMGAFTANAAASGWLDQIDTRTARFDHPDGPWVAALAGLKQLGDEGCQNEDRATATYEDSYTSVASGEAAMFWNHNLAAIDAGQALGSDVVNDKLGFKVWSVDSPKTSAVEPLDRGTYYLPKTGDPQREAAALEWNKFILGSAYADYVQQAGALPVLKDVPIPDSILTPVKEAYDQFVEYGSTDIVWNLYPRALISAPRPQQSLRTKSHHSKPPHRPK